MENGTYSLQDIVEILGLSKATCSRWFRSMIAKRERGQETEFIVLRAAGQYRVPKESFDKWFNQKQ